MRASKNYSLTATLLLSILPGCTTSSYKVIGQADHQTDFLVTPDRILLECEDIKDHENADDPKGNFLFMIHVLDEQNTVFSLIHSPILWRKDCFERMEEITKILRNGKSIYIGAHGTFDNEPRKKTDRTYTFPKRGVFPDNDRGLQFTVIQNELGQCYNAMTGTNAEREPCMPPEFPIAK